MGLIFQSPFKSNIYPEAVTLELRTQDEGCAVEQSAEVTLLLAGEPFVKVQAYIDKAQGADGGWYNVIKFREVERCLPLPVGCDYTEDDKHAFEGDPFTGYQDNIPLLCKVCGEGELHSNHSISRKEY